MYTDRPAEALTAMWDVQAAKEAGVQKFVHVSALGADANSPSEYYKSKVRNTGTIAIFCSSALLAGTEEVAHLSVIQPPAI